MDSREFLGVAQHLRDSDWGEAAYRSAISRAYYASYLTARHVYHSNADRALLLRAGASKEQDVRHDMLIRLLKNASVPSVRQLGTALDNMRKDRHDADYDMQGSVSVGDAESAVECALAFLTHLIEVPSTVLRSSTEAVLRVYGGVR